MGKLVDEFLASGPALPMEQVAVYVATGMPSERIVALATAVDADLIVLGTHGRHGIGRMLLGSVAEAVVRRAPCGVFVIRPRDFLEGQKLPEIPSRICSSVGFGFSLSRLAADMIIPGVQ